MTQTECDKLFVYGVLMFPEVLQALLGKKGLLSGSATLPGYQRFGLNKTLDAGSVPALTAVEGAEQQGLLVQHLTSADLAILDFFEETESGLYRRELVRVHSDGQWLDAWAYLVGEQLEAYMEGQWQPEQVSQSQLQHLTGQQIPQLLQQYRQLLRHY